MVNLSRGPVIPPWVYSRKSGCTKNGYFDQTHKGFTRYRKSLRDFIKLDPDDVALDSDRYENERLRLDPPVAHMFDTPIGHLNTPLIGDTLVNRPSPSNHDTPSPLKTPYREGQERHFPRVSRQSSRGRYDAPRPLQLAARIHVL